MTPNSASVGEPSCDHSTDTHAVAFSNWVRSKKELEILQRANAKKRRCEERAAVVVIVDNEPVLAITLAEILRRHKFNAVWFTDPLDALGYARDGAVDLLLSDFTMPRMDGVLLATEVRRLIPHCPVFLFSALCEQPEV
jgi:PleD family two-component response regulator